MNLDQNNHLRMFRAVLQYLNSILSLFTGFTPLLSSITKLGENVQTIDSLAGKQELDKTGFTEMKEALRDELNNICLNITSAITVWATHNKKNDVRNMFSKSKSVLRKMKENEISQFASQILVQTNLIAAELVNYKISAAMISELSVKYSSYKDMLTISQQKRSEEKEMTTELDAKIRETSKLLKDEIDKMMQLYENTNPTEYGEYRNLRNIEDLGVHHKKTNGNEDETAEDDNNTVSGEGN